MKWTKGIGSTLQIPVNQLWWSWAACRDNLERNVGLRHAPFCDTGSGSSRTESSWQWMCYCQGVPGCWCC
ncbi:hypothetical protein LX36DRAFT_737560 [Colletotrichum falcatum]|nr:hypothetical protein LX36DRAFT_737560 [Colletotrichum falcatum]